jgi:hypothetical protein
MIEDYIEHKSDSDYNDWKLFTETNHNYPVTIWTPKNLKSLPSVKISVLIPSCTLDDILPFFTNP